jgi:hypothetical protein
MRQEKLQMLHSYNSEGLHVAVTEGVSRSEASEKENVDPIKSIGKEGSE